MRIFKTVGGPPPTSRSIWQSHIQQDWADPRGPGPCGSHARRPPHFAEQIWGGGLGSEAPPEKRSRASSRGKVREEQTTTPPSRSRLASRDLGDAGAQAEGPMGVTWETCKTPGAQAAGTQVPLGGGPCPAARHLVSWELPEFCMHPSPPSPAGISPTTPTPGQDKVIQKQSSSG